MTWPGVSDAMTDRRAGRPEPRATTRIARPPRPLTVIGWATLLLASVVLSSLPIGSFATGSGRIMTAPASAAHAPLRLGADLLGSARASMAMGHGPGSYSLPGPSVSRPAAPLATTVLSMAYDAADRYVLVLSPNVSAGPNGSYFGNHSDSWKFSGGAWTKLSPLASPGNRGAAAMTYDAKDGCVLLFGGYGLGGAGYIGEFNDTWSFVNGSWTNLTRNASNAPSVRSYAEMVWDASDQYDVLYGGFGPGGNLSDTWSFSGTTWTPRLTTAHPPFEGALGYDSHDGYVVHFGGTTVSNYVTTLSNDTWKFHAGSWQNLSSIVHGVPPGRAFPMLSDDPNLGGALLFGGNAGSGWLVTNDSWSYVNQTWTLLSAAAGPSPRYMGQMVFDAADNATLLFGGMNLTAVYSDTWAFRAGGTASTGWAQAAPILRTSQAVVDAGISITFSAGSVFGSGAGQFAYSGLPPGCQSANAADLTCVPSAAGTFTVRMTALLGGATSEAYTSLRVNPELQILSFGSSFPSAGIDISQSAAISLELVGGVGPFTYSYPSLPSGCASQNASRLVCTPDTVGTYSVVAHAVDAFGGLATASGTLTVNAWPTVASFSASAGTVTVGDSLTLRATAAGGTGPLVYSYAGLPTGCAAANVSVLTCSPTAAGSYAVTVGIRDAVGGNSTSGVVTVFVAPAVGIGGPHPVSGTPRTLFTSWFAIGLGLGLVLLAALGIVLVRAARERADGKRIVADLSRRAASSGDWPEPDSSSTDDPRLRP
jgi:hypothetical protein